MLDIRQVQSMHGLIKDDNGFCVSFVTVNGSESKLFFDKHGNFTKEELDNDSEDNDEDKHNAKDEDDNEEDEGCECELDDETEDED